VGAVPVIDTFAGIELHRRLIGRAADNQVDDARYHFIVRVSLRQKKDTAERDLWHPRQPQHKRDTVAALERPQSQGSSDAHIVRGLIAILLAVYSGVARMKGAPRP
jgi:hypothetical protein